MSNSIHNYAQKENLRGVRGVVQGVVQLYKYSCTNIVLIIVQSTSKP